MNIKALITTLAILGSSSVAMARPITYSASAEASWSWGTGASTRPTVRDHRDYSPPVVVRPAPARARIEVGDWRDYDHRSDHDYQPPAKLLAEGLNFSDTEYRKDIVPGAGAGRFNTLRIDSNRGQTFLVKVVIEFSDGGALQVIDLNRTLRGNQSLTIDLAGQSRTLHRVLIYRADGGAAESINLRHRGFFDVTAL